MRLADRPGVWADPVGLRFVALRLHVVGYRWHHDSTHRGALKHFRGRPDVLRRLYISQYVVKAHNGTLSSLLA